MFIEETKFCPKCGQELKDKKCPNCDFKSKFIFTGKIFLVGVVGLLVWFFVVLPFTTTLNFKDNCGIYARAEIINTNEYFYMPALIMSIVNTSDKDIEALRFYAVYYNAYGEEIENNILLSNYLSSYTKISAGKDEYVKFNYFKTAGAKEMKVYLYSTYFADKTEWGDRKARKNTIIKYGKEIPVTGEFQ